MYRNHTAATHWRVFTRVFPFQVRAEITNKEREEEDIIEKVQKEVKYVPETRVCSFDPVLSGFQHVCV